MCVCVRVLRRIMAFAGGCGQLLSIQPRSTSIAFHFLHFLFSVLLLLSNVFVAAVVAAAVAVV